MKSFIYIIIAVACLTSCTKRQYTVIENVNVFDGEKVLENVDFAFSSDKIEYISAKRKHPNKATIIDGEGMTILPPLINAHVHVRSSENLKEGLHVGIFAMLDMFSTDERANSLRAYNDSMGYSKFYSSNVGATPPGGHGTQFGVDIPTINDTTSPAQFVNDRISENADYIKISHESSMSRLDTQQIKELILESHKQDKITVAHISNLTDAIELVEQDIDGLGHIWYRQNSIITDAESDLLQEEEIFVIPTLSVITKLIEHVNEIGLEESYLSIDEVRNEVRKIKNKGVVILAGTDSPNYNMNYSSQYFEELLLLKECGLTEIEILKSATTNIYSSFGLVEFNQLQKNESASFLLVQGQPYLRIEDVTNKKRIWKNGLEVS